VAPSAVTSLLAAVCALQRQIVSAKVSGALWRRCSTSVCPYSAALVAAALSAAGLAFSGLSVLSTPGLLRPVTRRQPLLAACCVPNGVFRQGLLLQIK